MELCHPTPATVKLYKLFIDARLVGLKDRTAIVTGGASGVGRAISLRLAREGCNVTIWDRDISGARRVAAEVAGLGLGATGKAPWSPCRYPEPVADDNRNRSGPLEKAEAERGRTS